RDWSSDVCSSDLARNRKSMRSEELKGFVAQITEEMMFAVAGVKLVLDFGGIGGVASDGTLPLVGIVHWSGDEEIEGVEQAGGFQLVVNRDRVRDAQAWDT